MVIDRVKIRRLASGERAESWRAALGEPSWLNESTLLKEETRGEQPHWVRRGSLLNRSMVIKCRPVESLAERLKMLARHGRGDRHWRGAAWLAGNGFATATCRVLATARLDGEPVELLVMDLLPGASVLEHLREGDLSVRQEHAVAAELGRMITRLTSLGRYNRDPKPSNLIVVSPDSSPPRIATIDCVAILRGHRLEAMLASLVIEAIGEGVQPRTALMARTLASCCRTRAEARLVWGRVARAVDEHVRRHHR